VTCSLLWVRCLFERLSISDFGGKWPLKSKFSKMSFWIPRQDTELRFVTNFGGNRPLQSCRNGLWFTVYHTKKLALRGTRPSLHFAKNGPIAPKITWTLSPLDKSTYTEFGLDRLCFVWVIPERLIFRPKQSLQGFQPTKILKKQKFMQVKRKSKL